MGFFKASHRVSADMTTFFFDSVSVDSVVGPSDGLSPLTPFYGLEKLSELTLSADDIVALRAGAVFDVGAGKAPLLVHARGGVGRPVVFTRYGAGDDPKIKSVGPIAVDVLDSSFVRLECFQVEGGSRAGVRIDAKTHHASFQNLRVSKAGFGFEMKGSNSLFSYNSVHDLQMIVNTPGGDDDYGAVAFAIQGNENVFSFNHVWNAKAPSFDYGSDGGGFEFWKSVRGVSIHHNLVEGSSGFVEAGGEGVKDRLADIEIFNNVSYLNGLFQWVHNAPSVGKFGLTVSGLSVHHNTIVEPSAKLLVGFGGLVKAGSFSFTRNLVLAPHARVFSHAGDFHFDNFYDVNSTPVGRGEVSGRIRFAEGGGRSFQVMRGDKAEFYGAYSLGKAVGVGAGGGCGNERLEDWR